MIFEIVIAGITLMLIWWLFKTGLVWVILLLLFIFVMAMIGGFDMSYKAWDQANARYQVPNPECRVQ